MGKCGHFIWTVKFIVKGKNARGRIVQEVVRAAIIKDCDNPANIKFKGQDGNLVFEAWDVPPTNGPKDSWSISEIDRVQGKCQGEYGIRGIAYFTKSQLRGTPARQAAPNTNWADLGLSLLAEGYSFADYALTPTINQQGQQFINAVPESNVIDRSIKVSWNCCNGRNKTKLVSRTPDP